MLGAGAHTLRVAFTPADALNYVAASTTVSLTVDPATPALDWPSPAALIYGTALDVAQLNATADVPGTFAYTPPAGTMLGAGAHTLRVAFTPADALNYVAASTTVSLTVDPATPALSWASPAALIYGPALGVAQLNATADVPGTFAYTPPAGTVLAAGAHTLRVDFTPADALNYVAASSSVSLTVDPATPALSWASPAALIYGTALGVAQLNATADVPGTFAYTPAAGTMLGAGAHTLRVAFTPADALNYVAASTTVSLTVDPATPALSWASPAALTYGTALGVAQLKATADVPGTFAYTPPTGTMLVAGSHTLRVAFTPADALNHVAASTTVSLTVDPSVLTITAASVSRAYHTANPALAWTVAGFANGDTAGVLVGEPLLSCTATLDSSVADGPYAIAVTSGTLTAANYSFACVPGALTVVRATPEIIWPAPAPLEYGTGLSALQLNATANTAGTFTYTPPVGTRLDRGPHLLAASFAPADVANWTSASAEPRTLAVVDTTAAWVTTLAPATAAVGVARDAALVLTFSEPVLPGTGAVRIMDEAGGVFAILAVDGRGAVTIDGSRVTIAHAPFAAGRAYHVLVASTCFRDLAGNAFAGIADPGAWAFTVRPWYVTFAAGEFGTLAGGESAVTVAVKQGDPLSAVPPVTPVEGWRFVDWEPLLPAALSADLLVTAQYARRVWTVAYAAAAPGRIDGAALQAVPHGASATAVAAIAGFGDVFDHWSDGRTDSPRTDTNVVADLELTAIFRAAAGVAPNGSFLARCAAPAAATGQGFWDLTGDYSLTLNGNPLLLHLLHDPRGRLTGTARLNVATGTTVVPLSLSVRGTFGGAGTVRRATLVLQGTNAARTVGADLTLVLTLDAEARQLRGPATGSLRSGAVSSPVAAVVTLALPLAMDGTWTLLLELVAGGRGVTGRALLTLANGVDYAFVVTGRRQGAAVLLNLAGGPADPAARSFEVTTTITALEGRQARLDAFSGRGHGQVVQW
jgi:hypothetical protein